MLKKCILFVSMMLLVAVSATAQGNQVPANVKALLQQQADNTKKKPKPPASPVGSGNVVKVQTTRSLESSGRVFGDQLFTGSFADQVFVGFNPDYEIASGDRITLQMWGGFDYQVGLTVDAQGNIFIPKIGPVMVRGVKNKNLNEHVTNAVAKTFKSNVGVYASLMGAEPVKVFVTGFIMKPGLYAGHSSDSILRFIDLAGGIDKKRGSFVKIDIMRAGKLIHQVNLYDFLLKGHLPVFQIFDGDTILLKPVGPQVSVMGLAQNPFVFEFNKPTVLISDVLSMARPTSKATHIRVNRNNKAKEEVEYYALNALSGLKVQKGDVIEVTSDKQPGTIAVRVEGEHLSSQEHILPYGATLGDLMAKIRMSSNAKADSIQLFRESQRVRQKEMLDSQLRALENSLLTARSETVEEATLRAQEAQMVLQWVERAKDIEPKGQVVLGGDVKIDNTLLEANDIIRIPRKSNLVAVHGDVMFPTAMIYSAKRTPQDYVNLAGGFVQKQSRSTVLILHQDGTFEKVAKLDSRKTTISPGDEILVLPRVQTKYVQGIKSITEVLYRIAVSAGVVLRL